MVFSIYKLKDVVSTTGLSRSSIYRLMAEGSFPKQINLGARAVGWLSTDIESWVESRISLSIQGGEHE